ncbi:FtsX-like permease family protein [Stieleria neptunia]|uniref:FtsX-like permease family protein n=1 Tax=Stieleria neptunia TaxID=2527979 RepID=UPI001E5BBACA|nr:FtsX-like permease family protein [Stieleria neptunia]
MKHQPDASSTKESQLAIGKCVQTLAVLELNPISQSRVTVTNVTGDSDAEDSESSIDLLVGSRPPVNGAPPLDPTLVSTPAIDEPYELVDGAWLGTDADAREVVVGIGYASENDIAVGDTLQLTTLANQVRLRVVGLVDQAPQAPVLAQQVRSGAGPGGRPNPNPPEPTTSGGSKTQLGLPSNFVQGVATNAVYVRPQVAAMINGDPSKPQVLQLAVRDTVTVDAFRDAWQSQLASNQPPLKLIDFAAVRGGLESSRSVSQQRSQAWAATGMASLAAVFIIFSTLSMGVSERARELAMLRAVALTRAQIAGIIAMESVLLALIGWLGGLATGWALVLLGSHVMTGLFGSSPVLGWGCVVLTGLTVVVGSLGAAILPAWRAMRIQPIDAMSARTPSPRRLHRTTFAGVGLLMMAATPILVFALPMPDTWRTACYAFVAYPMLLFGTILIAPTVVILCEQTFGPMVTGLLRLDRRTMQVPLSSNLWRTVGATLALSVGLGLYTSTQTWGYSMLQPFTPGRWLPDMLVAFHPIGLDETGLARVKQVEGVRSDQVLPLSVEQARFAWDGDAEPTRLKYDNAVIFGLDPAPALTDDDPFLNLRFVDGDRQSAAEQLADGRGCLISQDFQISTGLGIGDELHFTPPAAEHERVTYRIAAVVSLPGWHWVTKFSGVRRHFVRTATMVMAGREQVRRDFHLHRNEFYWLNLDDHADLAAVESQLQSIAERDAGTTFTADGMGEVTAYRPFARATATENVRKAIRMRADDMIWGMSLLPLITLAVMSLAIANTMIASVRSRTWEFGVMRSIGVTRSQLVRLVVAESVLIGIAAVVLSLLFGLIAGWCGVGMAQYGRWFAGPPTFIIPWSQLSVGFALTIVLCLLAGLWPAIKIGRAEPLTLLTAGRTAQ